MLAEKGIEKLEYKFGTMIEIPRAAVTAGEIAKLAEFFSFGTNDLTQMTFGYSRDDAERNFLVTYVEQGILPKNPFQTTRPRGRWPPDADGNQRWARHPARPGSGHLRRTRRRPGSHRVLPHDWQQLRLLLAFPRAGGSPAAAAHAALKHAERQSEGRQVSPAGYESVWRKSKDLRHRFFFQPSISPIFSPFSQTV